MKGPASIDVRTSYDRKLTELEERVLFGLMDGMKYTAMARTWGMNDYMVRRAGVRIYDKLGASNKVEAVQMAIQQGVLHERYGYWGG